MSALTDAIAVVERAQAIWDETTDGTNALRDYAEWSDARKQADAAATALLTKGGVLVRDGAAVVAVKAAGVSSNSTGGLNGAMSNWLVQAGRRLAAGAPA